MYIPPVSGLLSPDLIYLKVKLGADKKCRMVRYLSERKAALLKKLQPPINMNMSVAMLARQEHMSDATLYNWLNHAKDRGAPVLGYNKLTDEWPAGAKFAFVLSEIELSEYCRSKGNYSEQILQ